MDDKAFELLTKMYSDFTEKIDNLQKDLKEFSKETGNRLIKIETSLENEVKPSVKAALEGYHIIYEAQKEQGRKLDSIDNRLEKQDVEITVIKGGIKKKVK